MFVKPYFDSFLVYMEFLFLFISFLLEFQEFNDFILKEIRIFIASKLSELEWW